MEIQLIVWMQWIMFLTYEDIYLDVFVISGAESRKPWERKSILEGNVYLDWLCLMLKLCPAQLVIHIYLYNTNGLFSHFQLYDGTNHFPLIVLFVYTVYRLYSSATFK